MAHAFGYLTLGLALLASACAQPARDAVAVRFSVFGPASVRELSFLPQPGAAPQALAPGPSARSPRYSYRGAPVVRFTAGEDRQVVAEASLPAGSTDLLLLFLPPPAESKGGLKYRVAVLDDSPGALGAGGLAIVNFSGLPLAGTLGDQPLTLKEGLNPGVNVPRGAPLVLNTRLKGRDFVAYEGAVALKPGERALLVLQPPFYPGSPQVRASLLIDQAVPPRKGRK